MSGKTIAVAAVIMIAVAAGLWAAGRQRTELRTVPVEMGRVRVIVAATGKVEPDRESDIASKVSGRVTEFRVKDGDRVEAGQVLVTLDPTEFKARKDEAEAAFREAERNVRRFRTLFERKSVSRAELDAAEATHDGTKAALDRARAALGDTVIRAPFGGLITRKFKEVGEVVNTLGAPEPILRLADTEPLKVRAEVDENDVGKLAVGQDAAVTSDAYPGRTFHGSVAKLASQVGRKTVRSDDPREPVDVKILETEIRLEPTRALPIGMTVDVTIDATPAEETPIVPRAAVRESGGRAEVSVLEGRRVTTREVRTGAHDRDHVAILSGLRAGERVVVP